MNKLGTVIGAGVGLAAFLAVGFLPSLLYGGYAGVLLAHGIFGTPVEATFVVRALIVFGMLFGTIAVGSLFAVIGAVFGTVVQALIGLSSEIVRPMYANRINRL